MVNQNSYFKIWSGFRKSELYRQPTVCMIYTELCFRHGRKYNPVTKSLLIENLGLSRHTVERGLQLLLQAGFIEVKTGKYAKEYSLCFDNEYFQPEPSASPAQPTEQPTVDQQALRDEFLANDANINILLNELNISREELRDITDQILNDWSLIQQVHNSRSDFMKHLLSSIRIKVKNNKQAVQARPTYISPHAQAMNNFRAEAAAMIAHRLAQPDTEDDNIPW